MRQKPLTVAAEISACLATIIAVLAYLNSFQKPDSEEMSGFALVEGLLTEASQGTLNDRNVYNFVSFPFWFSSGEGSARELVDELSGEIGGKALELELRLVKPLHYFQGSQSGGWDIQSFLDTGINPNDIQVFGFCPYIGPSGGKFQLFIIDRVQNKIVGGESNWGLEEC